MNEISISSLNRVANQYEATFNFLNQTPIEKILHKPASGKWSIHENLAHLGRYQEVFIDRINAILMGDNHAFKRYSAESDPDFNKWILMPNEELLLNFKKTRR